MDFECLGRKITQDKVKREKKDEATVPTDEK